MAALVLDTRLELERDLFRECLGLAHATDTAALLAPILGLLQRLIGADRGYIELIDTADDAGRRWRTDTNIDDELRTTIRRRVSQGIVAVALESDEVVHTHS